MMAPIARMPNRSGTTFTTMVSVAAKPAPKSATDASSTSRDGNPAQGEQGDGGEAVGDVDRGPRSEAIGEGSAGEPAQRRAESIGGERERRPRQADALVAREGHDVDGHHERQRALEQPGSVEVPVPRIGQRLAQGGAGPDARRRAAGPGGAVAERGRLGRAREPHGERGRERDEAGASRQPRVGMAPAHRVDEPRRERASGDVPEVEPDEDDGERETAARDEPVGDGGGAQQIEARHPDSGQHAHEEIELPEAVDRGDQHEAAPARVTVTTSRSRGPWRSASAPTTNPATPPRIRFTRQRGGDGAPAPAEGLGEHGQEDAVGGERGRDPVGDREERGHHEPAADVRAQGALAEIRLGRLAPRARHCAPSLQHRRLC